MDYSITALNSVVDEGAGTLTFTIARSSASSAETLYVSTTPDQGFANSGDYAGLLNVPISFGIGQTTQTITVKINDDTLAEVNETFGIIVQRNASDPASTYLAKSTFTIRDNDAPPNPSGPIALWVYPATRIDNIGQ